MIVDNAPLFSATLMTADLHSPAISAQQFSLVDVQAVWTGTPAGNLYIETSDDVGAVAPDGTVSGVTNWSTYTGSTTAAGGAAGNFTWHIWAGGFRWVRLSYTFSSSTGSLSARVNLKD
jgi:hypothetical protein